MTGMLRVMTRAAWSLGYPAEMLNVEKPIFNIKSPLHLPGLWTALLGLEASRSSLWKFREHRAEVIRVG